MHDQYALRLLADAPQTSPASWSAVLYFYAAVHAMNYALFGAGRAPNSYSHHQREQDIDADRRLNRYLRDYRNLKRVSVNVRYQPWVPVPDATYHQHATRICHRIFAACGIVVPP